MKDEFGFDGEEEQKQNNDDQPELSHSRIRNVADADDDLGGARLSPPYHLHSTPLHCCFPSSLLAMAVMVFFSCR